MKIFKEKREFKPITIVLETREDYDDMMDFLRRAASGQWERPGHPDAVAEKAAIFQHDLYKKERE